MKLLILLLALVLGFGIISKKAIDERKQIMLRNEIKELQTLPNLLPTVEIVASRA
jgi:hypothetical protein